MVNVEMSTKDIERETGIRHDNILRDLRNKYLKKYPLNSVGVSTLRIEERDFTVKSTTYKVRGKEMPCFTFNKFAANAFMANYKIEHAMKVVVCVDKLEQELTKKQEEVDMMKSLVWEVINGQAYLSQEQALKMANVKHPRLFMKYLKGNKTFYEDVVFNRNYLKEKQCNAKGDRWWKFTKDGFKWLLENNSKINEWVSAQKALQQKVPC